MAIIGFCQVAKCYAQAWCSHLEGINERNIDSAIQAFENARELYTRFRTAQSKGLSVNGIYEIADVSENLASLYLRKYKIQPSFEYCQKVIQNGQICIQLRPNEHVGYYYIAEGFRMMFERQMDALENYRRCYQLLGSDRSRNVERRRECFLHLLALGILHGSLELPDIHECDRDAMCTALFGHLVNSGNCTYPKEIRTKCIHYLMLETEGMLGSGLATRFPFNASSVMVLKLCMSTCPTPPVISALVEKGMVITSAEIKSVVQLLGNGQPDADLMVSLCTNCIDHQGYYYIAEGFRMMNKRHMDALENYRKCYQLSESDGSRNVERRRECFLHILALGILHGSLEELPDIHECDQDAMCTALFGRLVNSDSCPYPKEIRTKCIHYLILETEGMPGSGLAIRLPFNASSVKVLKLCKNTYPTPPVINALVNKGMTITSAEIKIVVQLLGNDQPDADLLVSLCTNCQKVDFKLVYSAVLRQDKPMLAVALIHCGHKVDPEDVLSKIKYSQLKPDYAASLVRLHNPYQRSKLLTDVLKEGNRELIHAVLISGSLLPNEVHVNKIAPEIIANLGYELLNELFAKIPLNMLGNDYFKCVRRASCSGEVKADFLLVLLEHNVTISVDDVLSVADPQKVGKERVAKIARLCSKDLRTKVLKSLLATGNNKAIIVFLDSGPIKPDKVNPRTIALQCFINPDWEMLELLLKKVSPCGPRKERYFEAIQKGPSDEVKAKLFCLLLKNKAEVKILNPAEPTQVIHVATELAMNTGNMELLETACALVDYPLHCNALGQTPFHLAMKRKESSYCMQACEILSKHPQIADPLKKDKFGKVAADYADSTRDKRLTLLLQSKKDRDACAINEHAAIPPQVERDYEHKEQTSKPESSLSQLNEHSGATTQVKLSTVHHQKKVAKSNPMPRLPEPKARPKETEKDEKTTSLTVKKDDSRQEAKQWKSLLDRVVHKGTNYFRPLSPTDLSRQESEHENEQVLEPTFEEEIEDEDEEEGTYPVPEDNKRNVTWEVECTEEVVKFLKSKRCPPRIIAAAIKKIDRLGHERPRSLCKPVAKGHQLFEAKLTKSARILWGYDIQFSDSCTKRANKDSTGAPVHIYTEVIRVWDIVLDHDKIHRAVDNILKSIERGKKANVTLKITGNKQARDKRSKEPREFVLQADDQVSVIADKFVPAASSRDDEYNVRHFYSVSTEFVNSILNGEDARRDFPFIEWPKEHDIINMPQGIESILLLGRSGTGKTTCCLYRLWNEFHRYWKEAIDKGRPLCLRRPLSVEEEADLQVAENEELEQEETLEMNQEAVPPDTAEHNEQEDLEHLHQVFVTKNYVLCAQVRKKFYDLCASHHKLLVDHLPFEDKYANSLPTNLSLIEDHGYPLFLTSREFLILLDNSIDDLNTENSDPFFLRDIDGNLAVTILSSDYDNNKLDALLEPDEDNDNESDDEENTHEEVKATVTRMRSCTKQQEVTSQYFSEKIWPKIGHKCDVKKDTDPLLVWMEIKSFIKGSTQAVESSTGFLTLEEYETLGRKMAVNFAGNREMIYSLFKEYQSYRQKHKSQNLFDECDLLHSIYQRLRKRKSVIPWSIHCFYIDEVQDFTQAELLLVLHCCRDPNGLFLTGDTAQSIMRGVSFRFKDVVSLFHEAKEKPRRSDARNITVPTIHKLEQNFRSHSGILKLAASVIHLLEKLFPFSFDNLPEDKGLYHGPKPVLLVSCDFSDLAYLLRKNKRQSSFIELGAHQVIIVQTEAAKQKMPDVFKFCIKLTVFEAKGLEFDDVLLYNFFHDSNIEREWRVVASPEYAQDTDHGANVQLDKYMHKRPHAIKFDEREHKSLNPELKYLYTAITRAKCNLWIYDENSTRHDPMFYYWISSGLVKPVSAEEGSVDDDNSFQGNPSTPEEWKEKGDLYKEKHILDAAIESYSKAGARHLEEEAKAYMAAQQAKKIENDARKKQQLYTQAAECFLLSDKIEHEISLLEKAAKCFRNAKQYNEAIQLFMKLEMPEEAIGCLQRSGRLTEAGKLCETVGKMGKAKKLYKKARDYTNLSRVLENEGRFSKAVEVFDEAGKRFEALEKAKKFEQEEFILEENFRSKELASKYVKIINSQKRRKNEDLIKVVKYLPLELRLKYLKQASLFEEAVAEHLHAGQHKQAERVMSAQGMYDMAIKEAKKRGNKSIEADFTLEKILSLINAGEKISVELINSVSQCGIKELKAEAHLLHSRVTQDKSKAMLALTVYQECMNPIGKLESYSQLLQCGQTLHTYTVDIIRSCSTVRQVTVSLLSAGKRTASDDKNIKQALDFYHIRKEGKYVVFSECHNVWLLKDELKPFYDSARKDDDGMVTLRPTVVTKIAEHLDLSIRKLLKESAAIELQERLKRHHFHVFIRERHYLMESLSNYPPQELILYLSIIEQILNITILLAEEYPPIAFLMALLSPLVTWFLPFSKIHCRKIAQCKYMRNTLQNEVLRIITSVLETQKIQSVVMVDDLLSAWRSSTIAGITGKFSLLAADNTTPYYYLVKNKEGKVFHFFKYWLSACEIVRMGQSVTASAGMMFAFLAKIAGRRSLNISVINFVDIATVCTIGLTATVSISNGKYHLLMPKVYEHIAQVFDDFNTMQGGWWLLDACLAEVATNKKYNTTIKLETTCVNLLFKILQLILGIYNQHYNVLQYALNKREDGSALYCLELAVVLIANLYILSSHRNSELHNYLHRIYGELSKIQSTLPQGNYFTEAYARIGKADSVGKLFELSQYLMRIHKHNTSLCIIGEKFKSGRKRIMFVDTPIPLHFYKKLTFRHLASTTLATASTSTASTSSSQEILPPSAAPLSYSSATTASIDLKAQPVLMQPSASTDSQEHTPVQQEASNLVPQEVSTPVSQEVLPTTSTQHSTEEGAIEDMMVDHDLELDEVSARVMGESSNEESAEELNRVFADIDPSLIDEHFCGICGEHLREEETALPAFDEDEEEVLSPSPQSPKAEQPIFPPLASQELKTLKEHCQSASHEEKRCAHKIFSEIETNQYTPLKMKMEELLSNLSSKEQLKSEQDSLCETCRSLLRERELEEFRLKYEWRNAATLLTSRLVEQMESLCGQLDRAVAECRQREESKAQNENNQDPDSTKDEKPQDEQDDENEEDEEEEEEETIEIAERKSKNEPKKSRGRKKRRK